MEVVVTSSEAEHVAMAEIWQQDLAKIGVKLTIRPLERTVYLATALASKFAGAVIGTGGFAHLADPTTYFIRSGFVNPTGGTSMYRNPRYTQLVEQASTEIDAAKRKTLFAQLNEFYLDEVPATPLGGVVVKTVSTAKVNGLGFDYSAALETFGETWIDS